MLHIEMPNKIIITKVKRWVIFFEYDNAKYMIHEDSCGYETTHGLYKREIDQYGRYQLERLASAYSSNNVEGLIGKYKGRHPVYSQINKTDFATRLVSRGLATTDSILVKEKLERNKYYLSKANGLEAKAREYRQMIIR